MKKHNELSGKHCKIIPKDSAPIKNEQLVSLLKQINTWKVVDHVKIEKDFHFKTFKEALTFVNKVGETAERENHHPDITISYTTVKLRLSTHSIGGLSENDFIFAKLIDDFPESE